ncbi:hypothetical protein AVEN_168778-1 [Araneus ventricosus]|uniref:Uncharacterized protein n=1 Tax=Araneus ventricosus TaxID=182803 RepID=A0A4Y2GF90_ARAVE|nr:hypothetical protein AVEN_168778-1 [Araneus ventricosus]
MNETWCHYLHPTTKRMCQEWRHASSPRPKKAQSFAVAGKVVLNLFFDIQGPLIMEWMFVGNGRCSVRYCDTLQNLCTAIKSKHPGKLSQGEILL